MELKHFFAPDMRTAIHRVKEALGPDAIIFSHRRVEGGVEIEAAIDREDPREFKVEKMRTANESTQAASNVLTQMQAELKLLRNMLEHQVAGLAWQEEARLSPETTWITGKLREMGISKDIAQRVVSELQPHGTVVNLWKQAQDKLLASIPKTSTDMMNQGGVVVFVGPTGVGKTTTIAKIAARYTLRHGAHQVGLITTDSYRVAAREQLNVYGNILRIPVLNASNQEQLEKALETLKDRSLILVDTAGISQREINLTDRLSLLTQQYCKPLSACLVLAANVHEKVLNDVVLAFKTINLKECILTKLDETASYGAAISTLIRHQLPLCYLSTGQRVPEDLQTANGAFLLNKALETLSLDEVDLISDDMAL